VLKRFLSGCFKFFLTSHRLSISVNELLSGIQNSNWLVSEFKLHPQKKLKIENTFRP
jgi:hypothetical protein